MEVTMRPVAAPDVAALPAGRPLPLPLKVALPMAVASGLAMLGAFPPYDQSWLAPVSVALLAAAAHRRRIGGGLAVGLIAGLVYFVPLLVWTHIAAGWSPWALLSVAQSCYFALLAGAAAWLSPLADRWRALWPVLTGLLWTAQEALRDRAPFGGFPWGRLAFSQSHLPALRVAVLGGAPLVTFVVAATGGVLVALLWRRPPRTWRAAIPAAGYLVAGLLLVVGPAWVPASAPGSTSRTIAIVQGNVPRLGLDFNAQRRAVLDNHVRATLQLAADVRAGRRPKPDLVIWPENSSDIDPTQNPDAAQQIDTAAVAVGVPILVGTMRLSAKPNEIRNVALLWEPGTGPDQSQSYVKRHPVPFAEYMPLRPLARLVSDKADLVMDMVGGNKPGVVHTGPVTLGDVICFEVAYDGIVRDTVTGGAQLISVQTNNATFNEAEARQQLAMVQERAVEHGRPALMVSTVGVSAFVQTTGRVVGATGFDVPAVVVRDVRIGGTRTLATRLGYWPEAAAVALLIVALLGATPLRRRRTRAVAHNMSAEER